MKRLIYTIGAAALIAAFISSGFVSKIAVPKFEAQIIDDNVQIGYGLGIGDVDGDGKDDILLADKKQFVWYRNGDWQRFVMVDNLTERDNVCLAARDIDGDGQVEVAVGAQWNPGETSSFEQSGSVHYLIRPEDPTKAWKPVKLHHEPTVHRMRWVKTGQQFQLIMLPLHGVGNKDGQGAGVKVIAYQVPDNPKSSWEHSVVDQSMHLTHNFELIKDGDFEDLLIGGKEGAKRVSYRGGAWSEVKGHSIEDHGFGEIRANNQFVAGIQPLHGHQLVIYHPNDQRRVLSDSLQQGHALAVDDLLETGRDQIVAGWRNENEQGEIGVKLFISKDADWDDYESIWIDRNGMACEDLKVADLDGDGKKDIIAAGRDTHNLKVYWNKSY